jgi:hypothetical protein
LKSTTNTRVTIVYSDKTISTNVERAKFAIATNQARIIILQKMLTGTPIYDEEKLHLYNVPALKNDPIITSYPTIGSLQGARLLSC